MLVVVVRYEFRAELPDVGAPGDMLAGGELPLAGAGPASHLLTSPPQCTEQLQAAAPAPLGARGRAPRRPMLPFLLLRVETVRGHPASSRLHGLLVVGPLH